MFDAPATIKNAFRISKVRGESAARIRVPGGHLDARHLSLIQRLSEQFGNGTVHLTTRQGFEVPGIKLDDLDRIRLFMAPMIAEIERDSAVELPNPESGYPAAGARNVSACIGNRVCQFANTDTTELARKIESAVYPNHHHLKIAVTGCHNDCIKAHMQDIAIIACVVPNYDEERCIACEACVENCRKRVSEALTAADFRIARDETLCIRCGECVLKCPTGAMLRGKTLFRILIGGRTGKRNPRLAGTFIRDASESVALAVCRNVYRFIDTHIDRSLPKEHLGYIIDRAGFDAFRSVVLHDVELNPEAMVEEIRNPGHHYPRRARP